MKTFIVETKNQVFTLTSKHTTVKDLLDDLSALRLQFILVRNRQDVEVGLNLNEVVYIRESL